MHGVAVVQNTQTPPHQFPEASRAHGENPSFECSGVNSLRVGWHLISTRIDELGGLSVCGQHRAIARTSNY